MDRCEDCGVNNFRNADMELCGTCEVDYYRIEPMLNCEYCGDSRFRRSDMTSCEDCAINYYKLETMGSCQNCGRNNYRSSDMSLCEDCGNNFFRTYSAEVDTTATAVVNVACSDALQPPLI